MKTNRKQIQLAVCKALLDKDRRCSGAFINDNEFAVTVDGHCAYVFDKRECIFDISQIRELESIKTAFVDNEKDAEIRETKELFIVGGKMVEKYENDDVILYAYADVVKQFKGFHFYAFASTGRVLVKDDFGRAVGLFLPMRYDR